MGCTLENDISPDGMDIRNEMDEPFPCNFHHTHEEMVELIEGKNREENYRKSRLLEIKEQFHSQ